MERLTIKKITGPRALAAEGLLFIAGAAAACSPTPATETQRPTVLPTESPIPTMTIAPTESPVITPTESPVITPKPEATPNLTDINTILNSKPAKTPDQSDTLANLLKAWDISSEIQGQYSKSEFTSAWKACLKTGTTGINPEYNQQAACQGTVFTLMMAYKLNASNPDYAILQKAAYEAYWIGESILKEPYNKQMTEYLQSNL